jgi:hypothetical protein
MNTNQFQHETWRKAAGGLVARLGADYRNHRMLCDPWARAAHSMVQGWRIIASQGRLGYVPPTRKRSFTWKQSASRMKALLDGRLRSRLIDQNSWQFWARQIRPPYVRYIRKSQQTHHVHKAP